MKKGLIVILIFLVIISITGVGLAARPPGPPLPTQGPIGDLLAQIDALQGQVTQLTAEKAALQTQVDQLTAANTALQGQVDQLTTDLAACNAELPLATPIQTTPADQTANLGYPMTLNWEPVSGAIGYYVELYYYSSTTELCGPNHWCDPTATWTIHTAAEINYFTFTIDNEEPVAWRVMAEAPDPAQNSAWSDWRQACTDPWTSWPSNPIGECPG